MQICVHLPKGAKNFIPLDDFIGERIPNVPRHYNSISLRSPGEECINCIFIKERMHQLHLFSFLNNVMPEAAG